MTAIRENGATSGIGVLATFAYDDLGRRTSLTLGNGAVTNYAYDPLSRLDELELDFAGTSNDLTSAFAYNPASQIASTTRSNDAYAWTGHGSGMTSTTANGLNQIGSWVSSLGYDARGNVTGDGTYAYTYSSENLLTSLTNSATGAIQTSSTYAYDPLMRLAVIDSSNSGFDASLGYDGQDLILEGLSSNRTRRYVRGPGADEPLVAYLVTSTGTSRVWYQADERGSIVRHSNDSGTPGLIGKLDEYGVGGIGRIRYTGQYWLGDANLLYYRARVYDARLGRFLQPDPIGYGGGMNMYAYVGGDPVNFKDPTGLKKICVSYPEGRLGPAVRCVDVDGDGNGITGENDMSESEVDAYRADFFGFIVAYGGTALNSTRLVQYGKTVIGNLSQHDATMVRVTSQFVGAAIAFGGYTGLANVWNNISSCTARCGSAGYIEFSGSGGISSLLTLYGSPSNMARAFLHEAYHGLYPSPIGKFHQELDSRARAALTRMGLGGGGCVAISGFPGC